MYNKGFKNGKKRAITGSAWLREDNCKGALHVRFFWPFKSEYNVIKIKDNYSYAVVMGSSPDSLWILSRKPQINSQDFQDILIFLIEKSFNLEKLSLTKQSEEEKL